MSGGGFWAVVPAKDLAAAKGRLGGLLDAGERAALATAMLEDVLAALRRSPSLAGIVVVTRDARLAASAHQAGARVLTDLRHAGPNAAIALAQRALASEGARGMLAIPADIPLASAAAVERILAATAAAPAVTLVPALADMGSNALALAPVDAIPPCFGPQSFFRHQEAALARGIAPAILRLAEIGFDLDRAEDLARFLKTPSPTRSYAYLRERNLEDRLARRAGGEESACEG